MKNTSRFFLFLFALFVVFGFTEPSHGWDGVVDKVVDGETLVIRGVDSSRTVKLYGIDAPELGQTFGQEAKQFLEQLVLEKKVKVIIKKSVVQNSAEVFLTSGYLLSINKEMLKNGFAWSLVNEYAGLESTAKKKRIGIWTENNPTPPAKYRQAVLEKQKEKEKQDKAKSEAAFEEEFLKNYLAGVRNSPQDNEKKGAGLTETIKENTEEPDKLSIKDVDLIIIRAILSKIDDDADGVLQVYLHYKSKAAGKDIYWKNAIVSCDCKVTFHFTDGTSQVTRETKDLNDSTEDFYINIPKSHLEETAQKKIRKSDVECKISTDNQEFKVSDDFYN